MCNCHSKNRFEIGDIIHGFCGGYFGRDSYSCKKVEYIGHDYIVFRILNNWCAGEVMSCSGNQEEIFNKLSQYMEKEDPEYYGDCGC